MKKQTKILSLISFILIVFTFGELSINGSILRKWIYYASMIAFCGIGFWIILRIKLNKTRSFVCECSGFPIKYDIKHPGEYYKIIERIKEEMSQGKFILIKGTCPLDEINKDKPFPDDIIEHNFKCISCGCIYELFVDTYHGGGQLIKTSYSSNKIG